MSDLFSIAVIGGFILLLRKWGKHPEPAKHPHNRPQLGRPPIRSPYPRPTYYEDDEDDD